MKTLLKAYNYFGKKYLDPILTNEQKNPPFARINERSIEYAFAFKHLSKLCKGNILDVGPGKSSWPHLLSTCGFKVVAIDKISGYWSSYFNRHYKIRSDDIVKPIITEKFKFITCLSVLEHIADHQVAMKNIYSLMEAGGYLLLSFPYNELEYHYDIYKHPDAGYGMDANFITQIYSRVQIDEWMNKNPFQIVEQLYYKVFTGDLWTFGNRITPCLEVEKTDLHHLTCILMKKA